MKNMVESIFVDRPTLIDLCRASDFTNSYNCYGSKEKVETKVSPIKNIHKSTKFVWQHEENSLFCLFCSCRHNVGWNGTPCHILWSISTTDVDDQFFCDILDSKWSPRGLKFYYILLMYNGLFITILRPLHCLFNRISHSIEEASGCKERNDNRVLDIFIKSQKIANGQWFHGYFSIQEFLLEPENMSNFELKELCRYPTCYREAEKGHLLRDKNKDNCQQGNHQNPN